MGGSNLKADRIARKYRADLLSTGLANLSFLAFQAALERGHDLGQWERIDQRVLAAECLDCGLYAVADMSDDLDPVEGPIYGSTTKVPCQGPGTAPAWAKMGVPPHGQDQTVAA